MLTPWQKSILSICAILTEIKLASSFLVVLSDARSQIPLQAATPERLSVPIGILGPPEPLRSLKVGQSVKAFRSMQYTGEAADASDAQDKSVQFTTTRLSHNPDIFHLQNFVTRSECAQIKSSAEATVMNQAETVTKGDTSSRTNCKVAWLNSSDNPVVNDLVSSTVNIFLSKEVLSHPSAGVEDLQVLQYDTGGEFIYHHDGDARIMTVIYYLNGVAGTWFPLARTNEDDLSVKSPVNKAQALDLIKYTEPGKNGILARGTRNADKTTEDNEHTAWINEGDAIAFYNYLDDGSAQLDWRALHCGLPTTDAEGGTKWISNHWYRLNVLEDL